MLREGRRLPSRAVPPALCCGRAAKGLPRISAGCPITAAHGHRGGVGVRLLSFDTRVKGTPHGGKLPLWPVNLSLKVCLQEGGSPRATAANARDLLVI